MCRAHGGAAPQVRAAAGQRLALQSLERKFAAAEARHRERVSDWWADRITWLADVIGTDPVELARESAGRRWWIRASVPLGVDWPPGLRDGDEPEFRLDRRYGRRGR